MTSPKLGALVRRFADQQQQHIAAGPADRRIVAQIATVTAGGASDGNALVTVTWRGQTLTANGYNRSYAPVVGHMVVCDLIGGQLLIAYSPVGAP
jgi:hypothetical protein